MAGAQPGDKVKVHYTGKLDNGTVFDSSRSGEPIEFTIGAGEVIPGFEQAVVGMNTGDATTAHIAAEQAYGAREKALEIQVDRTQFPRDVEVRVGQEFQLKSPEGEAEVRVIDVTDKTVTLDANHPLAGQDLTFEIELLEIAA